MGDGVVPSLLGGLASAQAVGGLRLMRGFGGELKRWGA